MPVDTVEPLTGQLDAEAARVSADVDRFFAELLPPTHAARDRLYEAMRHAAVGLPRRRSSLSMQGKSSGTSE